MITFIKSPSGAFGLAYFVGDTAELPLILEDELVGLGYAEKIEPEIPESKQPEPETPERKRKKA